MTSVNPGAPHDEFDVQKYVENATAILSELRTSLKIAEKDDTPAARTKLGEALSKEIYQTVLSSDKKQDALKRMGQAGCLPNSAYTIQQSAEFANRFYRLGVKRQGVIDAIKNADDTQHLLPEGATEETREDMSLFLKRHANHWLMVQTHRQGVTLSATSAWLVFPAVVDLTKASKPIDVLRSFVEAFGVLFTMNGHEYLIIESTAGTPVATKFQIPPGGRQRFASFSDVQVSQRS
jgi:hypothetical protein